MKLEHKFREGFKNKMNEVVNTAQANLDATAEPRMRNSKGLKQRRASRKYGDSDDDESQISPTLDVSLKIEDLFGKGIGMKKKRTGMDKASPNSSRLMEHNVIKN